MSSRSIIRSALLAGLAAASGWTAARADNQTADYTQPVTNFPLPYNLSLAVNDFGATPLPTLQSFASAQQGGDWVMLGGRTNGLHGFSSGIGSFPAASQSHDIWVVDPVTKQSWSRSLDTSGLSVAMIDALSASSYESMQVGGKLYVVGGYGFDRTNNTLQTYSNLTSIDLDSLVAWVKNDPAAPSAASIFRTIQDSALQVTGGGLASVDGRALLVFGQNFTGNFNPAANGNYTSQVRGFDIVDSATNLAITNYSASPSPGDDSMYRRTHSNLVGTLHRDPVTGALSQGVVALGGVFTSSNGVWTVPVTIGGDGVPHMADPSASATLKQAVNVYSAARFGSFSATTGANYISLFGGLTYADYDPATKTYFTDVEIPFTNTVTTVTIDRNGKFTQSLMANTYPTVISTTSNPGNTLLFGTDAQFFTAAGITRFSNGVIDLDSVMANATADNVTLGYIFGGIASTLPNTNTSSDSGASNTVFAVTMALPPLVDLKTPGTVTAGNGDFVRRLAIEDPNAQYVIPAGTSVTVFGGGAVQSGSLVINGTLDTHLLSITGSGVVRGTGTINAPGTIAGILRPGNSPGTLTFTQSVTQDAAGTLMLDIDGTGTGAGAGNYSRLSVTGAASTYTAGGAIAPVLRGISGSASNTFTPALGQHFTVVNAEGGVSGTYASVTEPATGLAPGTRFDVFYAAKSIDLVVTPASFASLGALGGADTFNRTNAGTGLDALRGPAGPPPSGDQASVLTAIYGTPVAELGAAFDQVAGAVHGDALVAASALDRMVTDAVPSRRADDAAPLWVLAVGQWTNIAGDGNAPGNRSSAGGIVAGYDLLRGPQAVVGIAAAHAISDVATKNAAQAHVETSQLILYGGWTEGDWRFDDHLSAGFSRFHSRRLIQVGTLSRTASGAADGWVASGDLAVHYGDGPLVPFGEFHYDYAGRSAFAESGAGSLSLNVRDGSLNTPRTLLGGEAALDALLGETGWMPTATLAWVHDFDGIAGRTDAALAGAPATIFSTFSSRTGRDGVLASLRAARTIDDVVSIFAEYGIEARARATRQGVTAGLRLQF